MAEQFEERETRSDDADRRATGVAVMLGDRRMVERRNQWLR